MGQMGGAPMGGGMGMGGRLAPRRAERPGVFLSQQFSIFPLAGMPGGGMGMMQGGMRPMGARETRRDVGRDWPRCQDGLRDGLHRVLYTPPPDGATPPIILLRS